MIASKRMITTIFLFLCLTTAFLTAAQNASADQRHSFELPEHGKLILVVPDTWKQAVRQPSGDLPPTITLSPATEDEFQILITPLWSLKKDPTFNQPAKVRNLIDNDLRVMSSSAVEKQVVLQEFKGDYGIGYYFLLTDKAPRPGAFPYVVRAGVAVGDLLLSVTVLCRSKTSEGFLTIIKALQKARQIYE